MDRRSFLRSVIVGTLAAPFVTRRLRIPEATAQWSFNTSVYRPHPKQREFFESKSPRAVYQGGLSMRYQPGKWYKGHV